jgi:hypothetical protein
MLTTLIVAIALAVNAAVASPSTPAGGAPTATSSASVDDVVGSGPPG